MRKLIYKNFSKNAPGWGQLGDGIAPNFQNFVVNSSFQIKSAFDIGFGAGHYLAYLKSQGFEVSGIDSNGIAFQNARKLLGEEAGLFLADMFDYKIDKDIYDLIFSISGIHHGLKYQIRDLIEQIYSTLTDEGKVFITLPTLRASKNWVTFQDAREIEKGTIIPSSGPEAGMPHSLFSQAEVEALFERFQNVTINEDNHQRFVITAAKRIN